MEERFKPDQFWPFNPNSNLRVLTPDTGKGAADIYRVVRSIVEPSKEPK